jgi:hypothetical protein
LITWVLITMLSLLFFRKLQDKRCFSDPGISTLA